MSLARERSPSATPEPSTRSASAALTNTNPVIAIIDDLDIRIINTNTGEVLRHLTLDPTIRYQPQHKEKP